VVNFKTFSHFIQALNTPLPYREQEDCMNKKEHFFKEIGKVFGNFGNFVFTGMVIGTILKSDFDKMSMFIFGGCLTLLFITGSIICLLKGGE
jgi:hypothetical protein